MLNHNQSTFAFYPFISCGTRRVFNASTSYRFPVSFFHEHTSTPNKLSQLGKKLAIKYTRSSTDGIGSGISNTIQLNWSINVPMLTVDRSICSSGSGRGSHFNYAAMKAPRNSIRFDSLRFYFAFQLKEERKEYK